MKHSQYLRLTKTPVPEVPPEGSVDLFYNTETEGFAKRNPDGSVEAISEVSSTSSTPVNATPSTLFIGSEGAGLEILSMVFGAARNGTEVVFVQATDPDIDASASYADDTITVTLPTDGSGDPVNITYASLSDVISDDLAGDWHAVSTNPTNATAGSQGTTSGGTDGTVSAGPAAKIFADYTTRKLWVSGGEQDATGTKWLDFDSSRRIIGTKLITIAEAGSGEEQVIIDSFTISANEAVNGAVLKIVGTATLTRISESAASTNVVLGFGPQYQEAQERCGIVMTGLAGAAINFFSQITLSTDGTPLESATKFKFDASYEPQAVMVLPTPEYVVVDINNSLYWEDNMTTRESPVGVSQNVEFKMAYSTPCTATYLVSYDLALVVEVP